MSQVDLLTKLEEWYRDQCDGIWEHGSGIHISTLDNPGWTVKINVRGTSSESLPFDEVNIDNGENDWLRCSMRDGAFWGAGDPSKLPSMLEHFLRYVGRL